MIRKINIIFSFVLLLFLTISCNEKLENFAVSADGVEIRFDIKGEGETSLVFVHGFSRNRTDWNKQMDYFSLRHKVISIDLAGFGESGNNRNDWTMEAFGNDVVAVINYLDLNNIILIGHSMGTPVILKAAQQIPDNIIGLVPVDMLHDVGERKSDGQIDTMAINMMNNITEDNIRSWFVKDVKESLVKEFFDYYNNVSKVGWKESVRSTFSWMSNDQEEDLKTIKAPIFCINSDLRIPDVELIRKYAPSFNSKIIDGIGHMVMWEAPNEFNILLEECIHEFLNDVKKSSR